MKKDGKTLRVIAFALIIVLIAVILVASTYAKYTTEFSGSDTVMVAKFDVSSNVDDESFSLFDTINDTGNTDSEADVYSGLIAPGTEGSFTIEVQNDSEVTVEYYVVISEEENDSNIPIEYSVDGENYYSGDEFSTIVNSLYTATGTLSIGSTTTQKAEIEVQWRWVYEEYDEDGNVDEEVDASDTALGMEAAEAESEDDVPSVTVNAKVVFTQVD